MITVRMITAFLIHNYYADLALECHRRCKNDKKMAWCAHIYGLAAQFIRHFHVALDVPILKLNPSI